MAGSWFMVEDCINLFGGKKFKIEIDSSIWREEVQNRNRLLDLAGRNSKSPRCCGGKKLRREISTMPERRMKVKISGAKWRNTQLQYQYS